MRVHRDGRSWPVGTAATVSWLGGRPNGVTVETAVPLVFEAYATLTRPEGATALAHERAVVAQLVAHTRPQRWWLGDLDTGAHDVVFPAAPRVELSWGWPYVRTGHVRDGVGVLPDLLFPQDRSWVATALWDDGWTTFGGPAGLAEALLQEPLAGGLGVRPGEDVLPPEMRRG